MNRYWGGASARRGAARSPVSGDRAQFLDLVEQLTAQDRRVLAAVVERVANLEAQRGGLAALSLIDDIEGVLRGASI